MLFDFQHKSHPPPVPHTGEAVSIYIIVLYLIETFLTAVINLDFRHLVLRSVAHTVGCLNPSPILEGPMNVSLSLSLSLSLSSPLFPSLTTFPSPSLFPGQCDSTA